MNTNDETEVLPRARPASAKGPSFWILTSLGKAAGGLLILMAFAKLHHSLNKEMVV